MIDDALGHWQTVALSTQVPSGKPVRISYGSDDYVLFRDAEGVCRALIDRCAHRRAPLSLGRLTEECLIECPYHGWRYDGATGACRVIPNLRADEKVPKTYRVQAFETVERHGFIQLLVGNGQTNSEPPNLELPGLHEQWEGERLLAYPEALFMETLVDCPNAILSIGDLCILDDHRYGDPALDGDRLTVEYAAIETRRAKHLAKRPAADFPYLVRLSVSTTIASVEVHSGGALQAVAKFVAVAVGRRIVRVLWRGSANSHGKRLTIECRPHIDALAVSVSNNYVSRMWSGALTPAIVA